MFFSSLWEISKNPFKLTHKEERLFDQRMVVMVQKVTQVKEMVYRKKRVMHPRKNRKQARMALSLKLRQR